MGKMATVTSEGGRLLMYRSAFTENLGWAEGGGASVKTSTLPGTSFIMFNQVGGSLEGVCCLTKEVLLPHYRGSTASLKGVTKGGRLGQGVASILWGSKVDELCD
jgi:hypothetical protein